MTLTLKSDLEIQLTRVFEAVIKPGMEHGVAEMRDRLAADQRTMV